MKRFLSMLLLSSMLLLTSCGNEERAVITYNTEENIISLDQQFVTGSDNQNILRGLFTPLIAINSEGGISSLGAESYSISPDGLTYTFQIHPELYWSDDTKVTGHDYAYGIKRIFSPVVSEMTLQYSAIKNAEEVMNGADISSLGVSSTESTLTITLSSPSSTFLHLLTNPASYPCKEDFFLEQKGRYAIDEDSILTCGQFQLYSWSGSRIIMMPNEDYPFNMAENDIIVNHNSDDIKAAFFAGTNDIYSLSYSELEEFNGYSLVQTGVESYNLIINPNVLGLDNEDIRKSIVATATEEFDILDIGRAIESDGIFPPEMTFEGKSYREAVLENTFDSDNYTPLAVYEFNELVNEVVAGNRLELTISYPNIAPAEKFANSAHIALRDGLSVNTNLEAKSDAEIIALLESGKFDIIIAPITSTSSDYKSYLNSLSIFSDITPKYTSGVSSALDLKSLEDSLMMEMYVVPMYYTPAFVAYNSPVEQVTIQKYTNLIIPTIV